MVNVVAFAFGLTAGLLQTASPQQPAAPQTTESQTQFQELNATDVAESLKFAKTYTDLGLSSPLTIDKERIFEGPALVVDTLVFQPGSRLVFAGTTGDHNGRYIVARTIRVLPGDSPVISWDRESSINRVPPVDVKAPAGSLGGGEGADGTSGSDGQTGNPGYPGRNAPTLYIFAKRVEGGPIIVDLRGQDGGVGGQGQPGGDGGLGRAGRQAVSGVVDCRSGGGTGGNGGKGGAGGKGGPGGRGGNGGTLIVGSSIALIEKSKAIFQVNITPGKGGPGGEGGPGGNGGVAGQGASANGLCSAGVAGSPGIRGGDGGRGDAGTDGVAGLFAITKLTDQQLKALAIMQ
jgi:hypothetical protein